MKSNDTVTKKTQDDLRARTWSNEVNEGFENSVFKPNKEPGPQNIQNKLLKDESTTLEWLDLLWDKGLWNLFVVETNTKTEQNLTNIIAQSKTFLWMKA